MKKNNDSKKDDNNYAKKDKKNKGIWIGIVLSEYYGAAEPPVRCGESHLSGLTEPLRSL